MIYLFNALTLLLNIPVKKKNLDGCRMLEGKDAVLHEKKT